MKDKKTFYITTPIYYPNDNLHIGHTYCTVAADTMARYKRLKGYDVRFLTGSDEHGQKIELVAKEKGMEPKEFLDGIVSNIKKLWKTLDISYDYYIRTTDENHKEIVKKIFMKLYEKGDIYKGEYEGHYCIPCEAFWSESQLIDNKCPDCGREVTLEKEETYFFRLSKYQDRIMDLISNTEFLQPKSRRKEMINNFLKPGLEDLSISRSTFDWGIEVPIDKDHVMYVWIDALTNYITSLGYLSEDDSDFKKYWPADIHLVGKEIVRFHSIIWPAILMALDVELPKTVFGHGWILFDDDKMSKSKGNIVYPETLIELYGIDSLKYFLMREFSFGSDGSFETKKFLKRINADLANDLGNLISRTVAMIEQYNDGIVPTPGEMNDIDIQLKELAMSTPISVENNMEELSFNLALEDIWKLISRCNKYIDETTPWLLGNKLEMKDRLDTILYNLLETIRIIGILIKPVMDKTSDSIMEQIGMGNSINWEESHIWGVLQSGKRVKKTSPMFPRLDIDKEMILFSKKNEELIKSRNIKKVEVEDETITIDDFSKVDLRVAKIKEVEKHPNADRLLVMQLEVGDEIRQVVSGIAKYYDKEELIGKTVILAYNLKPVELRGVKSYGMVLAADNKKEFTLLSTLSEIKSGSKIS